MICKRNGYKSNKEKKRDFDKRIAYIKLKYTLDKTLQEIIDRKK